MHHTRPGPIQHVVELERELSEILLSKLPLPVGYAISFHYGDARAVLMQPQPFQLPKSDLLVIDIFAGPHVPAHVTSCEFYREALGI